MMFGFKREKKARTDQAFVHFEIGHVEKRIEYRRGRAVLEKVGSELAGDLKRKTNNQGEMKRGVKTLTTWMSFHIDLDFRRIFLPVQLH